ncbi:MAG: U32 family peptidase [Acholeplasmataceae bacterium]
MKTLITLNHMQDMDALSPYVDGFIFGPSQFGARLACQLSNDQMKSMIEKAFKLKREVFIQTNQLMMDQQLHDFKSFVLTLPTDKITGFIVSDLGVFQVLKKLNLGHKVVYHPETLLTNYYDLNMLANEHIFGAYAAKEITFEDLKILSEHKQTKLFMIGHGHLNMFYSKRKLAKNFKTQYEIEDQLHLNYDLKIIEENRKDEAFPILEDDAGTHVFRSHVMHVLNHLDELSSMIDYLVIDTIFKDSAYALEIAKIYKDPTNEEKIENLKTAYNEVWDEGFFYKKTIYKQKVSI